MHDSLVTAAFSGLFLLKMANLFPAELDLAAIITQVEQLAQVLSDVAAERYALTLRIMLASLRRKLGLVQAEAQPFVPEMMAPFTMEELGLAWPAERGTFSPSAIPLWLQEQVRYVLFGAGCAADEGCVGQSLTDLGIPMNGNDGIFLQLAGSNGWGGDQAPMPEAW